MLYLLIVGLIGVIVLVLLFNVGLFGFGYVLFMVLFFGVVMILFMDLILNVCM